MPESSSSRPVATVLINTRNRREELRRAIDSVLAQTVPVKLLIVDDGSTDGTADFVRSHYPSARFIRNEQSLGIIEARNRAVELVDTELLFTLDDDAVYPSSDMIEVVASYFANPRVAVVAIPLRNHFPDRQTILREPCELGGDDFTCSFNYSGGANALRVPLFRRLGKYQGSNRQAEENAFCMRLLAEGYVVRIAATGYVEHYPSEIDRDLREIESMRVRNNLVFAWLTVPMPWLLIHLPGIVFNSLRNSVRTGTTLARLQGVIAGFGGILGQLRNRTPVSGQAYQLSRQLVREKRIPFSQVEPSLPSLEPIQESSRKGDRHYFPPRTPENGASPRRFLDRLLTKIYPRKPRTKTSDPSNMVSTVSAIAQGISRPRGEGEPAACRVKPS